MAGARCSLAFLAFLGVICRVSGTEVVCNQPPSSAESVYSFTAPDIYQTKNVSLSEYRGKVLVITNLASFWGLTPMHYLGYNALKQKFAGKQFEVLGFPCNQFNLVRWFLIMFLNFQQISIHIRFSMHEIVPCD